MNEPQVALTFDAEHPSRRQCPPGVAETILGVLSDERVPATFFIQGRWATAYPSLAQSLAANGHLIGNHSHSHAPMPDLSDSGLVRDIEDAEASIREVVGVDPRPWFRCPFGEGHDDRRVLQALTRHGYRNIHWHVAVSDWEDERQAAGVEHDVVDGVLEGGSGSIVLLHTWPAPTASALPRIIFRLREAGFLFVTVADII
jgi:peptidoglycan/xylan/chitin deacetylase (PgdA/CDA1 family)